MALSDAMRREYFDKASLLAKTVSEEGVLNYSPELKKRVWVRAERGKAPNDLPELMQLSLQADFRRYFAENEYFCTQAQIPWHEVDKHYQDLSIAAAILCK